MSLYHGEYIKIECTVCTMILNVGFEEWESRRMTGQDMLWVCWSCCHKFYHASCECGSHVTSYKVFHSHWCDRYRLDSSKEVIKRIKESMPRESDW